MSGGGAQEGAGQCQHHGESPSDFCASVKGSRPLGRLFLKYLYDLFLYSDALANHDIRSNKK